MTTVSGLFTLGDDEKKRFVPRSLVSRAPCLRVSCTYAYCALCGVVEGERSSRHSRIAHHRMRMHACMSPFSIFPHFPPSSFTSRGNFSFFKGWNFRRIKFKPPKKNAGGI